MCLENAWGTVCTHSWGRMDAAVVCQQLGYSTQGAYQAQVCKFQQHFHHILFVFILDAVAFGNTQFGAGVGPVYLDNVACSGSESNVLDCPRRSYVSCYSRNGGAGVRCQG